MESSDLIQKVKAVLRELPHTCKVVDTELLMEVCKRLGITSDRKWKQLAQKNRDKVRHAICRIVNNSENKELESITQNVCINNNLGTSYRYIVYVFIYHSEFYIQQ